MARRFALVAGLCAATLLCMAVPALAVTHPLSQASPDLTPSGPTGGPPWTFQMARIAIALLILSAIGVALAYRRFVLGPEKKLEEERRREGAARRASSESTAPGR